jgi:hypothetical protein
VGLILLHGGGVRNLKDTGENLYDSEIARWRY